MPYLRALPGGSDDLRMVRQAEIIIGAKVDDRFRLALVLNRGARIGRAEHVRLIKLAAQAISLRRHSAKPAGGASGSLRSPHDKITQTKRSAKVGLVTSALGLTVYVHKSRVAAEPRVNQFHGTCGSRLRFISFADRE